MKVVLFIQFTCTLFIIFIDEHNKTTLKGENLKNYKEFTKNAVLQ